MVCWALAQNLSSLPPDPKQAHLDRFQRDLVNAVERALMGSARSRELAAKWLLGREYVFASSARGGQHLARRLRRGFRQTLCSANKCLKDVGLTCARKHCVA